MTGESSTQGGMVDTSYGSGDAWVVHADSVGNFLSEKVLGSSRSDEGQMIYPLPGGLVLTGGIYERSDGSLNTLSQYGGLDLFLGVLAPWTTSIPSLQMNTGIKIFPNPAHQQVTVNTIEIGNHNVIITDMLGRLVYRNKFNGQAFNIEVNDWIAGIYYVQLISESGFKEVQKFMVL